MRLWAKNENDKGSAFFLAAATADRIRGKPLPVRQHRVGITCYADHLNTAREIYNSSQQLVWRKPHQEPFSDSPPDENPSGLGVFEFPLRESGYYADKETGNLYAMQRDCYLPGIGRFCQSDPIGIAPGMPGGLNTYLYVNASPLSDTDVTGLSPDYWWRPCNKDQIQQCRESCEKQGKEFESCAVRWIAHKGIRGGKPSNEAGTPSNGGLSCSCKEPQQSQKVQCDQNCQKTWKAIRDAAGAIILFVFVWACS